MHKSTTHSSYIADDIASYERAIHYKHEPIHVPAMCLILESNMCTEASIRSCFDLTPNWAGLVVAPVSEDGHAQTVPDYNTDEIIDMCG